MFSHILTPLKCFRLGFGMKTRDSRSEKFALVILSFSKWEKIVLCMLCCTNFILRYVGCQSQIASKQPSWPSQNNARIVAEKVENEAKAWKKNGKEMKSMWKKELFHTLPRRKNEKKNMGKWWNDNNRLKNNGEKRDRIVKIEWAHCVTSSNHIISLSVLKWQDIQGTAMKKDFRATHSFVTICKWSGTEREREKEIERNKWKSTQIHNNQSRWLSA